MLKLKLRPLFYSFTIMEKIKNSLLISLFLFFCLAYMPSLDARELETNENWQNHVNGHNTLETKHYSKEHGGEFDEYWRQKAKDAEVANNKAYDPNPYEVTSNLTSAVSELIVGNKDERRKLNGLKKDPCKATNPIDRCWRCDPNWADNRKKLADCVKGFGRKTTGGKLGSYYIVTDSSDKDIVNPKPGTLRHAVTRIEPLWIIFSNSMTIRLTQELIVTSHKTIDGRGANIHIANGAGFVLQSIKNVIICNLHIENIKVGNGGMIRDSETHFGPRNRSDGDGITIFSSSNVWIDHVSLRKCSDGLIDVTMGSTAVTISNNHFEEHNKVMLFGANDTWVQDKIMQVTVAFNHFGKGLKQRMPRCRFGFFHVVNNVYTRWSMYAIGGSMNPTIISEGNQFIAPDDINAKQVTHREPSPDWKSWQWRSIGDVLDNGAIFIESGHKLGGRPFSKKDMMNARHGKYAKRLTRYAGALSCKVGKLC